MDSKFALDGVCSFRDNGSMTDTGDMAAHKLQMLVLERRDPSRNMARFYVLAIEPTLFGDAALVREWGRMVPSGVVASIFTRIWPPPRKLSTSGWIERRVVAIESGRHAYCPDRRRWESCWRDSVQRGNGRELERAMDTRGFVADRPTK